jgi:16S rRNA (cytidine1402-2'-O)-methyltransferase
MPLLLVPTPIGNLEDITLRALRVLREADVIACEDTRSTGQLLKQYGIEPKQLMSNHEANEQDMAAVIADRVAQGQTVALVSDAGMPAVSDPGFRAVRACVERGLEVSALPGASAAVTALVASGLPTDAWTMAGFPPQKKGRATWMRVMLQRRETVVMYESPHRLERALEEIVDIAGADRPLTLARELTKKFEEYLRGTAAEVLRAVQERGGVKGECVIVIGGAED